MHGSRQESKRLAEAQVTEYVKGNIIRPPRHILCFGPFVGFDFSAVGGVGAEQVTPLFDVGNDIWLQRTKGGIGETLGNDVASASMNGLVDDGSCGCGVLVVKEAVNGRLSDVGLGAGVDGSSAVGGVDDDVVGGVSDDRAWSTVVSSGRKERKERSNKAMKW